MTFARSSTPGDDQFLEAGDHAITGTSRIGARAVMLLCQKTDLILGMSDSGRYAPEFAGRKSTPPISSGSESASGVTTRFAPSALNSSERRSPTSSETL